MRQITTPPRHHNPPSRAVATASIDTVECWIAATPQELQGRGHGWRIVRARHGHRLIANQPTLRTIRRLAALQARLSCRAPQYHLVVHRLDIGIEIITADRLAAERLQSKVERYLLIKWAGAGEPVHVNSATTYYKRARSTRNLVLYADRKPRIGEGGACMWLELRLRKLAARKTITSLADLPTINPQAVFTHHLREVRPTILDHVPTTLSWPSTPHRVIK